MVDPIIAVISLIVASAIIFAMLLTIIKNGYNIRDRFMEYYYDKKYHHLVLTKTSSLPLFIAICKLITNNRVNINCKQWQILNIMDSNAKTKIFLIPSASRYFTLRLGEDEFTLFTAGNYNGSALDISAFKIFFDDNEEMKNFIELVYKECTIPSEIDLPQFGVAK